VVKGDLTSDGTAEEYDRFLSVYGTAFGERLLHVRGNHESYHSLDRAAWPMQERTIEGATVALLDTSRDGRVNGDLSADQLDWLDELGPRSDRPVLVFGHHPIWNPHEEKRTDSTFGLVPDATDALAAVFARRPSILGYFAGHTHRNRIVHLPGVAQPFVEVACVKDYPGTWAEYRVYEGAILQVHRRISTPEALIWSEKTRACSAGSTRGTPSAGSTSAASPSMPERPDVPASGQGHRPEGSPGPLSDMRVIDVATVIAGPGCARYLADFGADVIKVERPGGDTARSLGWRDPADDESLWWKVIGRGKRCIALDLKEPADLEVMLALCDTADVLVENFRPGTLERLGLGPDVLHERNPGLVSPA
jgi:hypothetical protein